MKVANFLNNAVKLSEMTMIEPPGPARERAIERLHSYLSGLHQAYATMSTVFEDLVKNADDSDDDDEYEDVPD